MANDGSKLQYSRNAQVENLLTQWRIHWEYVSAFPLADIRTALGQQVRDQDDIAPAAVVDQYATQAQNGAKFPPIVLAHELDGKHSMIDGNTRRAMAEKLGETTFPAYVVHVNSRDYAVSLGAGINQLGGRRLNESESMRAAQHMLSENVGFNDAEIALAVGVTKAKVAGWRKEQAAKDHAAALDVTAAFDKIPAQQQRLLERVKQDAPFKELTGLLGDRRVKNDDVRRIVQEIEAASSEGDALEVIRSERDKLPIGGPGQATVVNQKARHMRMILPQIISMWPPEDIYDPERAEEDAKSWKRVAEVTENVLAMYANHGLSW
jgi:ParB-like chromosome segregation protein Spo0J